jgi:predicted amino acid dehydrogenase
VYYEIKNIYQYLHIGLGDFRSLVGSSLLLNKNKAEKSKTQNVTANQTETIDVSGNQILISPTQIQQAGIQLQTLGQATSDVQLALTLQGKRSGHLKVKWS